MGLITLKKKGKENCQETNVKLITCIHIVGASATLNKINFGLVLLSLLPL